MLRLKSVSVIIIVSLMLFLVPNVSADPTNSTWNYDKQGTIKDWNAFGNCGKKDFPQAPMNITNNNTSINHSWLPYHWSFLSTF